MKAAKPLPHARTLASIILQWMLLVSILALPSTAGSEVKRLKGQTVYVPAYSHIYHGDREIPFYLTVTLSIRNTDSAKSLTIMAVDYFDTDGKPIKKYQERELKLGPMGSTRYVIQESDKTGGSGANFIVKWKSDAKVTTPIIETIMISTSTQQGISFSSRGVAIEEED
jgi:hypothetical protein